MLPLQHHERRPQRRAEAAASASQRDGDGGLERVGEAVEYHASLVVAEHEHETARVVVAAAASRGPRHVLVFATAGARWQVCGVVPPFGQA